MVSLQPLSDPEHARVDLRMKGSWQLVTDKEDPVILHIGKQNDQHMVAVIVEHKPDAKLETIRCSFFTTQTQNHRYVNVRMEDIADDLMPRTEGYVFIKYRITEPEGLSFYAMALQPVIAAIRSGALKGRLAYRDGPAARGTEASPAEVKNRVAAVTISDSSAHILQFIDDSDHSVLFGEPMTFRRID